MFKVDLSGRRPPLIISIRCQRNSPIRLIWLELIHSDGAHHSSYIRMLSVKFSDTVELIMNWFNRTALGTYQISVSCQCSSLIRLNWLGVHSFERLDTSISTYTGFQKFSSKKVRHSTEVSISGVVLGFTFHDSPECKTKIKRAISEMKVTSCLCIDIYVSYTQTLVNCTTGELVGLHLRIIFKWFPFVVQHHLKKCPLNHADEWWWTPFE